MEPNIFENRELCWLYELALANGMSRDFLTKLVDAGDLKAVDMACSGAKRRKLAVHRDSWNAFIEKRTTVGARDANKKPSRRRSKVGKAKDLLARGKRKK